MDYSFFYTAFGFLSGLCQRNIVRWHPNSFVRAMGLVASILVAIDTAQAQSSDGQNATLRQAWRLAEALQLKQDTTVFKLLQDTYPAFEQPVSPFRVYQDYRGNPYIGDQLQQSYQRLIAGLNNELPLPIMAAIRTHYAKVNERQQTLKRLRQAIVGRVQRATFSEFEGLYTSIRPGQHLTAQIRQDFARQATLRDTFLLAVLSRFVSVSSGRLNMSALEKAAIDALFSDQIDTLRAFDNSIEASLKQLNLDFNAGTLFKRRGTETPFQQAFLESGPGYRLTHEASVLQAAPVIPQPSSSSLETAVLDGLARFVAKRLKEELNASFFERFNALLQDSSYTELRTFFPNTTRLVTRGSVDYSAIVQLLRSAFDKDLRELFFSLQKLLDQPHYRRLLVASPTANADERNAARLLRYTRLLLFTLHELQQGTHPLTIIRRLHEQLALLPAAQPEARQISGVIVTLAEALVQEGKLTQAWVDTTAIRKVMNTATPGTIPGYQEAFLGLVHQRLLRQAIVLPVLADPNRLYQLLFGFARLATDLQQQVDMLRRKAAATDSTGRLKPVDFVRLYQLALEVNTFATNHVLLHRPPEIQEVERVSQAVLDGYQAALRGRYGITVTNLLLVASITMPDQLRNRSQLLKYTPFMAALAEARDPAQMQQAIEAVALPAGSASVKRKTLTSITLNAFPGLTGGMEYVYLPKPIPGVARGNWRPDLGFTVPIGLCFSRAIRGNVYTINRYRRRNTALRVAQNYHYYNREGNEHYLKGQSLGIFVSLLDLGALVLYRLNDSLNTSPLPRDVTFRQVFSPGLWVMYHAGRSPLSLFAGGQLSPQLRQVAAAASKVETEAGSLRLNAGITIDIPLLSFYARSERRMGNTDANLIYQQKQNDLRRTVDRLDQPRLWAKSKNRDAFRRAQADYQKASKVNENSSQLLPSQP